MMKGKLTEAVPNFKATHESQHCEVSESGRANLTGTTTAEGLSGGSRGRNSGLQPSLLKFLCLVCVHVKVLKDGVGDAREPSPKSIDARVSEST